MEATQRKYTSQPQAFFAKELAQALGDARGNAALESNAYYLQNKQSIHHHLIQPEMFETTKMWQASSTIQVCVWNIERGMQIEGIADSLKNHPTLSTSDVFLLNEVDKGMIRSGNLHIAQELSQRLDLHGVFVPSYLNLDRGNGAEQTRFQGDNTFALQGHAILSRFPMSEVEVVSLPNAKDHMLGIERQLGCENAIVARVHHPHGDFDVACAHLAAHSLRTQRVDQVKALIPCLSKRLDALILGGDFNTTTYNSNNARNAFFTFWRRVFSGTGYCIKHVYPHPEKTYEKGLFEALSSIGLDHRFYNVDGGCTLDYDFKDPFIRESLGDWLLPWFFDFIEWSLKESDGKCSFKLDWMLGRGFHPQHPQIIADLPSGQHRYSDHHPIVVEVTHLQKGSK
ncbi:MAG: endonuclease/exonuclease/phosphatase family protein [Bdellovibrionota bacterium]